MLRPRGSARNATGRSRGDRLRFYRSLDSVSLVEAQEDRVAVAHLYRHGDPRRRC
jgi:hypothetical protein